jgi:hypothetical protein
VHGEFGGAGDCLAELVSGDEESVPDWEVVEIELLWIGGILGQTVN